MRDFGVMSCLPPTVMVRELVLALSCSAVRCLLFLFYSEAWQLFLLSRLVLYGREAPPFKNNCGIFFVDRRFSPFRGVKKHGVRPSGTPLRVRTICHNSPNHIVPVSLECFDLFSFCFSPVGFRYFYWQFSLIAFLRCSSACLCRAFLFLLWNAACLGPMARCRA